MENQTTSNPETNQNNTPENNSNTSLNKNVKIALIVIGVLILLGIIWRVQAYMTYRSYKKQADKVSPRQ